MSNQAELDIYKREIKDKINNLINLNYLEEARILISNYEEIITNDPEIYHAKSIIYIQEGKYSLAERILKDAIHIDNKNIDTYYNLGFLYQTLNDLKNAYKYYSLATLYTQDVGLKQEIKIILKDILDLQPSLLNEVSLPEDANLKKVLVVAHIFPPLGGSGVQRTLKFVKYLVENGWKPTVITVGKSKYPLMDNAFLSEIPENVQVIRIDEPENIGNKEVQDVINLYDQVINSQALMNEFLKGFSKDNSLLFLPDGYIYWANSVLTTISELVNVNDFNIIYTTSGPYSDHIIGYILKQKYFKPWVADFRDEWTNNCYAEYDSQSLSYRMQLAMESNIVGFSDRVITTTPLSADNYIELFHLEEDKVTTITNGYDEEDFKEIDVFKINQNEKFTIVHNGLFYSIRTPETFLQAVSNLVKQGKIDKNKISIKFSWSENQENSKDLVEQANLKEVVEFQGYLSHKKSLELASLADLLLLVVGPGRKNRAMYPGKIFEYLRLCRQILALSPNGSVVDQLINSTDRGINIEFEDVEAIENYILEKYNQWLKGQSNNLDLTKNIIKFERRELTNQLTTLFNEVEEKNKFKKYKIAFFSIKGGDKFLNDIIKNLENEYNVQKFIITELSQIDSAMGWADICWFEWCDQVLEYATKLNVASERKIICRLHRYEAFTMYPTMINWEVVDKLFFVSNHIKNHVIQKINLPKNKIHVIPNGINNNNFNFKKRHKGYNLAVLGHINMRKNPMLILQNFNELVKLDRNYKLYFAGDFSGDFENGTLESYLNNIIKKLNLEKNVFFDGFINNNELPKWLDDKNFIITGSISEGHPVGIMEAMSCGLKPVIHAYPGIEDHYPRNYYYYDVEDFIRIITEEEYDSFEYSKYISNNFPLNKQMKRIKEVLGLLEEPKKTIRDNNVDKKQDIDTKDVQEFYDDFLGYLKKDRIQTNDRHVYLKNRLKQIIKPGDKVLDLGCGIGITTEYISTLNVSKVIGVDLSPKLIENAREIVKNVEFLVYDITKLELNEQFDVISLCDVVEHIPRELYSDLFVVIKKHLKENGQVFISIPDPEYNDFLRDNKPEKMQIIDNSVTLAEITDYCQSNGLKIKFFNVYGIWLPNEYNEYILINNNPAEDTWKNFYL